MEGSLKKKLEELDLDFDIKNIFNTYQNRY